MTARELATFLTYVIIGLAIVGLLLLVLAIQQLRRGRKGPYWRLRRRASQRGGVLFLASLAVFVIAGALAFYSGLGAVAYRGLDDLFRRPGGPVGVILPSATPSPDPSISPTATSSPTPTDAATATTTATPTTSPSATSSPTPSASPSATGTFTPSPTSTSTPSPTATATVDSVVQLTPPAIARAPRAGASVELTGADSEIGPDNGPVQNRSEFPAGITRIYFFMRYRSMDDGVGWARVLYRDGVAVQGQAYLWSQGRQGESFFFFGNEEGYPPGDYEVRIFLGDEESSRLSFRIPS